LKSYSGKKVIILHSTYSLTKSLDLAVR